MFKNILAGIGVLIAAGVATWLFLPALTVQPLPPAQPASNTLVPLEIGPIKIDRFDTMLVVFFLAAGAPFAGLVMGLLVRWLGGKVPSDAIAATPSGAAAARKTVAAMDNAEVVADVELPLVQRLGWLALVAIDVSAIVFLIWQVLPPDFTLF